MQVCPSCGEENPERFRLCGYCGTPLAPAVAPTEERRTVTIVFSDLQGSTKLGETLDPEAVREVMSRYFDVTRQTRARGAVSPLRRRASARSDSRSPTIAANAISRS